MFDKKHEQVYNWVLGYINENKFSDQCKLPSEHALCRKLGVSRATVRTALERLDEEQLIYSRQGSGTYINRSAAVGQDLGAPSARIKIGLILQGQDGHANEELLGGVRTVLNQQQSELRVFFTDNKFSNERACLEAVTRQEFSGFIVDGVKASVASPNLDYYQQLYYRRVPVMFYNNYYKGLNYPRVVIDEASCADELVRRLVQAGHRHIAGLFVYDNYQSMEKFQGYARALQKYGAEFNDDNVKWCISNEAHNPGFGKQITRFLRTVPRCTAIVCCNYMLLSLVQQVLAESGKSIPGDYSVVCFDYSGPDWKTAGITCSVHPGYEMGRQVALRLSRMLQDPAWHKTEHSCILAPHIHDGASVGAV